MGNMENTVMTNASNSTQEIPSNPLVKKALSIESLIFLGIFALIFYLIGNVMGGINMVNTMIKTAYDLLFSTAFFVLAVAVLAGALSEMLAEFGVISAANKLLSPAVKPVYGMPGASMLGMLTTYFSDNPAILTFAENKSIRKYYKKYQLPALTNLGTCFGMGMVVTAFMAGLTSPIGETFLLPVVLGNIAAIIGGIVSTRVMLMFTAKAYGKDAPCDMGVDYVDDGLDIMNYRITREGSGMARAMSASMDGGATGVKLGMNIIPGILIITTFVIMLTRGPGEAGVYTGGAYEGVAFLPMLLGKIDFIIKPMFGFSTPEALVVPITAIGSGGAAISLAPNLIANGLANAHDVAIFTAICMCWSGYLSTHIAMMDALKAREFTGKAILSHTIGGICAGIAANIMFNLIVLM